MMDIKYELATANYEFYYGLDHEKNEYMVVGIDRVTRYMAGFYVDLANRYMFEHYVSSTLVECMDALTFRD